MWVAAFVLTTPCPAGPSLKGRVEITFKEGYTMSERLTRFFASRWSIILAGAVIGLLAPLLQKLGNPPNMGICVACFERDIAGALGLHRAAVV